MTPIYKGQGNRDDKNNYQPITVLPILAKLLEKHICDHLCDLLEENALLHRFQSGFSKFHSTETALILLIDQLLFDLDSNRASGLVFIDYKKAFDLIDHGLLLEKLKPYGVRDNELELLRSYLSGRTQYMYITMPVIAPQELCRLEYRKGAFWAPFCFSYLLMICHWRHSILP